MAFHLLSTKIIIPPLRNRLVQRSRLFETLDQSGYPCLILVTAPAGYGKTTLVSGWARQADRQVAWYALDSEDNDFTLFVRYLIAALQVTFTGFGQAILSILDEPPPLLWQSILTSLVNELATLSGQTTIVLDDYHLIENQSIHDGLIFLLEHLPETVEILIASRTEPPFPLHRWRGRGQLIEIRPADLRFTAEEVGEFLERVMGLALPPEDIQTLETRTEGWVTGLQMAALAIQSLPGDAAHQREAISNFVCSFSSSHRYILDYLWDEVIAGQPWEIQNFLLQTSLLERMSAPLCNAVTGIENSQALLESLAAKNLFLVPLDGERQWYRYHHLFAELLQNQLEKTAPESLPELHLHASDWYAQNGYVDEAITHVLASGRMEMAVALIEQLLLDLSARDEIELGRHWLQKFPPEIIKTRPVLCLAQSVATQYTHPFDWDRMETWVALAAQASPELLQRLVEIDGYPYKTVYDLVETYQMVLRAYLSGSRGDSPAQVIVHASKALEVIPQQDLVSRSSMTMIISRAHMNAGDIAAAGQFITEALELAQASGRPDSLLMVLWTQAYIAYRQGRYRDALRIYQRAFDEIMAPAETAGKYMAAVGSIYFFWGTILNEFNQLSAGENLIQKGLSLARLRDDLDTELDAEIGLAFLSTYRGEGTWIKRLDDYLPKLPPEKVTMLQTHIARMQLILGDRFPDLAEAALRWAEKQIRHLQPLTELEPVFLIWVRALLMRKPRGDSALDLRGLLEPLDAQLLLAESRGYRHTQVGILIVQALVYQALGAVEDALQTIGQALTLAQPEGYVRIFINERGPMRALLQGAIRRGITPGYAQDLLNALQAEIQPSATATSLKASPPLGDPLTPRELEVLGLIAAGLSNQQIAGQLVLAVGTVKKYTSNIFLKLNVNRRTQAVAKAKELGIL